MQQPCMLLRNRNLELIFQAESFLIIFVLHQISFGLESIGLWKIS